MLPPSHPVGPTLKSFSPLPARNAGITPAATFDHVLCYIAVAEGCQCWGAIPPGALCKQVWQQDLQQQLEQSSELSALRRVHRKW